MRLFPPSHEGRHTAFPVFPAPYAPTSTSQAAGLTGGISTVVPCALAINQLFGLWKPQASTWRRFNAVCTYGFLGVAGCAIFHDFMIRQIAGRLLEDQEIAPRPCRALDRLGHFDEDDALLTGAAIGVVTASLLPRPWAVVGWRRWIGAVSYGSGAGWLAFNKRRVFQVGRQGFTDDTNRNFVQYMKNREEYQALIKATDIGLKTLDATKPRSPSPATTAHSSGLGGHPATPQTTIPAGGGNVVLSTTPPTPTSGWTKIGIDARSWTNETDEPHLTAKPNPQAEPEPYGNTNYLWDIRSADSTAKLKRHIEAKVDTEAIRSVLRDAEERSKNA
ncbi:uncharacterized protein LTR77_001217 [Saxophila tyrrhenica]|uniref:Uncharacterized protein n=1 Tax=Saxophila tyrrhenica TaxID=1690608 RepID=A0AAV9PLG6_9PEZI|nr:hypothetical protein LTR77_001217 [Saxophila tyrrhenica]